MIHVKIITPEGVYKELDTPIVNIDTLDGPRGILPNHMPLVTMLDIGKMTTDENGVRETYAVAGGLFYFRDNEAQILTDAIENKNEIDVDRAESSKERAERRLHDPNYVKLDAERAHKSLDKALNRIRIAAK